MDNPLPITDDMVFIDLTRDQLQTVCSSAHWQQVMGQKAPFVSREHLIKSATQAFDELSRKDWLEAFAGHPMIGNLESLKKKYAQGAALSEQEQSGTKSASEHELRSLLTLNQDYVERFGFIFIVCATGQSAASMLIELKRRIRRDAQQEFDTATTEQRKISMIRLDNLILETLK